MSDEISPAAPVASVNFRGALFVIAGAFLLTVMASLAKFLGGFLPVPVMVFVRFLAGFLFLMPVLWKFGFKNLKTQRIKLHLLRGTVGWLGNLAMFFFGRPHRHGRRHHHPVSRPLFTVLLAGLFLGEVIGGCRAGAVVKGCDLVVFPKLALTTFSPRQVFDDEAELDAYCETEMPSPASQALFDAAKELRIGFYLGYAEIDNSGGRKRRFNTAILVDKSGYYLQILENPSARPRRGGSKL